VRGDVESVRKLISDSADLEARDAGNQTALMVASQHNKAGVVEQLLAAGAKTDVTDAKKMTALALAMAARV
jgi:ankyrin repeat protein